MHNANVFDMFMFVCLYMLYVYWVTCFFLGQTTASYLKNNLNNSLFYVYCKMCIGTHYFKYILDWYSIINV